MARNWKFLKRVKTSTEFETLSHEDENILLESDKRVQLIYVVLNAESMLCMKLFSNQQKGNKIIWKHF